MSGRTPRRAYAAALAAVLFASAVVLIVVGSREFIDYDSFWHVFIARQDRWPNFWREVRENAHPPLFYLALRVTSAVLGPGVLTYRAVSIAATVAAAALVAAVVRRTTANRPLSIVAAAAFGLSYGALMTGLAVRAYAMCAAFTLLAFLCYLDWLGAASRRRAARASAGFAVAATIAVLTHYSTFFFLAASLATPIVLAMVSRGWRNWLTARAAAHPIATAAMFGLPVAAAASAYVIHVTLWGGGRLGHVPTFMFNPATETPWSFLARNTLNLAAIVLPGSPGEAGPVSARAQRVAVWLIAAVSVAGLAQLGRSRTPRLAVVPLVVLLVMTALNALGGLTDRYPYGGGDRHEFFLVPFAVVGFFSLVEVVRRSLPRPVNGRVVAAAAAACGVVASVAVWASTFRIEAAPSFQGAMDDFRRVIPAPRAVLLDQFSFINFFSQYHDWRWRAGDQWPGQMVWQIWSVAKGDRGMTICRDDAQWSFDMSDATTFDAVVECGQRAGVTRVAIFRTHWWDAPSATTAFDRGLAARSGLTPVTFVATGDDLSAEFEIDSAVLHDCTAAPKAPADLHIVSNRDRTVTLAWAPAGGPRTSYIVEAGLRRGSAEILKTPIGRVTTYTATRVNPAIYYARVRARNTCGISPPSEEIQVTVP